MPAPKDPKKRKLWKENMSRARKGRLAGKNHPMFGKKRPEHAEL